MDLSITSFDDLPDVLVTDILSRLPAKTLVQSTSVSKLWYSFIKNPSFISAHLSRSSSDISNFYIFFIQPSSPSVTVISDNHNGLTRHPNFIIPIETRSQTYHVIGSCNGLICLTDQDWKYHGGDIYLINPFIRKYKKIDAESSCYSDLIHEIDDIYLGLIRVCFWYCEVEKDYKILRILVRYGGYDIIVWRRFEIYSLNSDTWKVMDGMDDLDADYCTSPIFVNGCLYWSPWPENGSLQCFDLKEKSFTYINSPKVLGSFAPYYTAGVMAKDGSLAFWDRRTTHGDTPFPPHTISLYFLDKDIGGWKELFHHKSHLSILYDCMGFSASGRFIFCERYATTNIVALDLDNNSCAVEKLPLDNEDVRMDSMAAFNVVESLVLYSG